MQQRHTANLLAYLIEYYAILLHLLLLGNCPPWDEVDVNRPAASSSGGGGGSYYKSSAPAHMYSSATPENYETVYKSALSHNYTKNSVSPSETSTLPQKKAPKRRRVVNCYLEPSATNRM